MIYYFDTFYYFKRKICELIIQASCNIIGNVASLASKFNILVANFRAFLSGTSIITSTSHLPTPTGSRSLPTARASSFAGTGRSWGIGGSHGRVSALNFINKLFYSGTLKRVRYVKFRVSKLKFVLWCIWALLDCWRRWWWFWILKFRKLRRVRSSFRWLRMAFTNWRLIASAYLSLHSNWLTGLAIN